MLMMTHLVSSARVTLLSPAHSGAGAEWRQHSEADLAASYRDHVVCSVTILSNYLSTTHLFLELSSLSCLALSSATARDCCLSLGPGLRCLHTSSW